MGLALTLLLPGIAPPTPASAEPLPPAAHAPVRAAATFPVRAAFYYPWFPQTWHADDHFHPTLGSYSSDARRVVAHHVRWMTYAGLDAAIASWWGRGEQHEDTRFPLLLRVAARHGFAFAPYYEPSGQTPRPSVARLTRDLDYLARYARRFPESFLSIDGTPVIFVYNSVGASCRDARQWARATHGFRDWYVSLKVFPGFEACARQPSAWHQYGPASAYSRNGRWYAAVSPGFYSHSEPTPRLARSPSRWCRDLTRMVRSHADWQLLTTFNEWGEGTAVEPAREWATPSSKGRYLDLARRVLVRGAACP